MSSPSRGRIIWVEVADPQGRNPKWRPAVIVTATENIRPDRGMWVVAISTQLDAAPAEVCVELPWDRNRHPRTGLTDRCVAVCNWLAKVSLSDIRGYAGTVPGKQLLEILAKVGTLPV